jgi:5-methylcytosine-specific restriction endonuclease McrA
MCRAGLHDLNDPANVRLKSDGGRQCKPCLYAYVARYQASHADQHRATSRKWNQRNRGYVNANQSRRRARKAGATVEPLTAEQIAAVLAEDPNCIYCGFCPSTTVDHMIPLDRGGDHSYANLVGACGPCNSSKGNRLMSEWTGRICPNCGEPTGNVLDALCVA